MYFFRKSEKKKEAEKTRSVDADMIAYVLGYVRDLELPEPSEEIEIKLFREGMTDRKGTCRFGVRAPHYLLVYGPEGDSGCLNAGYVLERAAALLRVHGIGTAVSRQIPELLAPLPDGRRALAVLAFGMKQSRRRAEEEKERAAGYPLICREAGEHWMEEVLSYAGVLQTPVSPGEIRVIRKEQRIHLAAGRLFGRSKEHASFHAGMVLASIMGAAEELWIDLCMVRLDAEQQDGLAGAEYVISVCRKQDCVPYEAGYGKEQKEEKRERLHGGSHQWRYA